MCMDTFHNLTMMLVGVAFSSFVAVTIALFVVAMKSK